MSRLEFLQALRDGLPLDPLPPRNVCQDPSVSHAPVRQHQLESFELKIALQNSLRYFPPSLHETLAPEFAEELCIYGHIYMYRFLPKFPIRAYPVEKLPARIPEAAAIMHMILNNLDPAVAQFPHELVTYGGNGQVFCNWAQFWLVMRYLSIMQDNQTLVINSGHPVGLFPGSTSSPKLVISNGMVIPNYSTPKDYDRMFAMGVTMYGQMTAGSYCYIGPQGIVHGTVLTVLNAGRKYLGQDDLSGKVYVTSGLGGMSGAQAKAAVICGCIGVIAEVNADALKKRYKQGWLKEIAPDLDSVISRIREAKKNKESTSIGYHGNIVTLWERLVREMIETKDLLVDLGSDQTSCHNPYNGGYYPVDVSFEEAEKIMAENPSLFRQLVQQSFKRHVSAINALADRGMKFWDYGNAFLLEASRAGADVKNTGTNKNEAFRYPSYVQDIMGDIFSLGFGPFRWVCLSGSPEDLTTTDQLALTVLTDTIRSQSVPPKVKEQYLDNIRWMEHVADHKLVVGSQARILYSDQVGRVKLALAFNEAIKEGKLKGPVVISRDHHDVSGTDSPYRETSNVTDGSQFTADMAVQNCIGDAFRGASWVALHNGGGVGWGEVINGGFGLVLDGKETTGHRAKMMLDWDVCNGVARRSWCGNTNAQDTIQRAMLANPLLQVTVPNFLDDPHFLDRVLHQKMA